MIFRKDKLSEYIKELEEGLARYSKHTKELDDRIKMKEKIALERYDEYKRTKAMRYKYTALRAYQSVKFDEGLFFIADSSVFLLTELISAIKQGLITEQELDRLMERTRTLLSKTPIEWARRRDEFYRIYNDIKDRIPWPIPDIPTPEITDMTTEELEKELEERWSQWKASKIEETTRKLPEPPKKEKELIEQ